MGCGVPRVKGDPKGCVLSVRRPGRGQHTQGFVCTVQQHALRKGNAPCSSSAVDAVTGQQPQA